MAAGWSCRHVVSLVRWPWPDHVVVEVVASGVIDDDHRERFEPEAHDRLRAQVIPRDWLLVADAPSKQGARAAYRAEVDRAVAFDRLNHLTRPASLANHAAQTQRQQFGGVGVHPVAAGWSGRANHVARLRRRWADIIDGLSGNLERQRFTSSERIMHALVCGVA